MPDVSVVDDDDELGQTVLTPVETAEVAAPIGLGHLQLVVIGSGAIVSHSVMEGAAISIGRSNACDITIQDESLSRRHAVLRLGERVTIEDTGSANGTRVGGALIPPGTPTEIALGEVVGIGTLSIILQQGSRSPRVRTLLMPDAFRTRVEEECTRQIRVGATFALLRICTPRAPNEVVQDALGEILRESDILAVNGAHEYQVLLPGTPPGKAADAQRRIKQRLVDRGIQCNVAGACCPRDGVHAAELLAKLLDADPPNSAAAGSNVVVAAMGMQSLYRLVDQVASSRISVLLLGETGVGKEVFARALHRASPRASGPFIEVNCAALTETLLESELFGFEKGAFTNAMAAKPGLIEIADGGTLLLDEIGDMPLTTQVKLLRIIEDSQLRRVGGLKARTIDVRFVAATNTDLEARIASGTFRGDLFYRLNGVTLVIPPLRERLEELEPLCDAFIRASAPAAKPPTLTREALELMRAYRWPGNVRELKHMIERAVLLCGGGAIQPEHLPLDKLRTGAITKSPSAARGLRATDNLAPAPTPSNVEQDLVQALEQAGGNQTRAAQLLGISRRTLVNRLNALEHLPRPRKPRNDAE